MKIRRVGENKYRKDNGIRRFLTEHEMFCSVIIAVLFWGFVLILLKL